MMKMIVIAILIYVVILVAVVLALVKFYKEMLEDQNFEYERIIDEKNEDIRILKQKLEEAKKGEEKARKQINWCTNTSKKEYQNIFYEFKNLCEKDLEKMEYVFDSFKDPATAIIEAKRIKKELLNQLNKINSSF